MRKRNSAFPILQLIIVIVVCVIGLITTVGQYMDETEHTVTVIDKGYSGEEDGYIVWVEDLNGTQYEFTNKDALLKGKFDSSTVQGKLKVGSTYNITTVGYRIPLFSLYPNIIEYELVENS